MRAFLFHPGEGLPPEGPGSGRVGRASRVGTESAARSILPASLLLVLLCLFLAPSGVRAQWPPELRGRVVDATTGAPISGALVEAKDAGRATETDGRGRFRIRGLEPGPVTVTATALGYADGEARVELENGRVARPELALAPRALPLPGLRVTASAGEAEGRTVDRSTLEESGARTVGELLAGMPGVTVRSRGPGGREVVSIRGEDAVLVLVDGAPMNDPVTGEADLSGVALPSLESVTVLSGARSTRFGPGAQGGVVLIETRSATARPQAAGTAGSLGRRGGEVRAGVDVSGVSLVVGAEHERMDGRFRFRRAADVGGGAGLRRNADLQRTGFQGSAEMELLGGRLRLGGGYQELERGLPGKSFAPSDSARERQRRIRATASWRGGSGGLGGAVTGYAIRQRLRIRDPAPPLGLRYDDRTRMTELGLRAEVDARPSWRLPVPEVSAGVDVARRSVRATSLAPAAPAPSSDLGVWLRGDADFEEDDLVPRLTAAVRAHRTAPGGRWFGSHELMLRSVAGPVSLHAAHRSAFSPPTLGDQYFREGVAVRPNPDLRAERVPGELEAGIAYRDRWGPARLELSASAFSGDVRDMIVWAPDFRFVWSPRNVDAERSGLEVQGSVGLPVAGLRVGGSFTRTRVVYDREGSRGVQLRYRPRHTGSLTASWDRAGFRMALGGRFVGRRTTVPARVNVLPRFWTVDLDVRNRWRWSGWELEATGRIDRLLDQSAPIVFAFPEPGRTVEVELRVRTPRP